MLRKQIVVLAIQHVPGHGRLSKDEVALMQLQVLLLFHFTEF